MSRNPILDLPLSAVMRTEIALPLQQILHIHTVGALLGAWRSPFNHSNIEKLFDSPQQARHAVAVCATWLGVRMRPQTNPAIGWWRNDDAGMMNAVNIASVNSAGCSEAILNGTP